MSNCISLNVEKIETLDDVTTLTVADEALQPLIGLCGCVRVNFCINTSFATERKCTRIEVTDGLTTAPIAKDDQYWRPEELICDSTIYTHYKNDPHLFVFCGGRKHS